MPRHFGQAVLWAKKEAGSDKNRALPDTSVKLGFFFNFSR